jgi:succinyl-diaminopimelate desuccinylase
VDFDLASFVEKYQLALAEEQKVRPDNGTTGFELEWNLYDCHFHPLWYGQKNGARLSFVDYLRKDYLPAWLNDHNKLEVFHWMTEWVTNPHYSAVHSVYEGWVLEACLMNALAAAGAGDGGRYYIYHGNLLAQVEVGHDSIPGSWNIAKRRYLERCVDLYGSALATAGTHVNLSLPETMLGWDYMHLPASERVMQRFDHYRSEVYISGARLMRAFAALSIGLTASTPMRPDWQDGQPVVLLTDVDSNRNLTFPNDHNLDVPHLYRSYDDYIRLSYDLIKRGVRFGNNNWTPVRARSSADPVERIISVTSEQLQAIYEKHLYSNGTSAEDVARQIEQENLMARIDLPMTRIELRTDESGHDAALDIAHLTLVELLLVRFYADPLFARAFRYDVEDIARVRRNESAAASYGMKADIEDPFTGKLIQMRHFLGWTLEQIRPLAQALDRWGLLEPLVEIQRGAPNTAEQMRARIRREIGERQVVPSEVLVMLAEEREAAVKRQVEAIATAISSAPTQNLRIAALIDKARQEAHRQPTARIDFHPAPRAHVEITYPDKTSEIVALVEQLIRIPSVTNCPEERLDEVTHAAQMIHHYLDTAGVQVRHFSEGKYPAIFACFPDRLAAPVMLGGHFDVVPPMPDDSQFEPRIEGDYLWGRGSADMKTVVATYLVWMKDQMKLPGPKPAISLLLVGNEENGEAEAFGTPHVLEALRTEHGYQPGLYIAGERTGERGSELFGEVCIENRGVVRFRLIATGQAGHTGTAKAGADLTLALNLACDTLSQMMTAWFSVNRSEGWASGYRFPFMNVGVPGVYNITATRGELGVEIRPIPQDNIAALLGDIRLYAEGAGLELVLEVNEAGIRCAPDNPHLMNVLAAVREVGGQAPVIGRKLPGTSARFAPGGQGIVWGQSGLAPHAADERHYLPSIQPYYDMLNALAARYRCREGQSQAVV